MYLLSSMGAALLSSFFTFTLQYRTYGRRALYYSIMFTNVFSSVGLRFLLDDPWKVQRVKIKNANDDNKYNNDSFTSTILGTVLFNANQTSTWKKNLNESKNFHTAIFLSNLKHLSRQSLLFLL